MTNEEAKAIIQKEYLCVDRDCDIERSCGKCDLMMPSKEPILQAYKIAMQVLSQESCNDAISRQAVIDTVESWLSYADYNEAERNIMRAVQSVLYNSPFVNPQQKTGHWIEHNAKSYECSECHNTKSLYASYKSDYCHDCGAKMIESQESEVSNADSN